MSIPLVSISESDVALNFSLITVLLCVVRRTVQMWPCNAKYWGRRLSPWYHCEAMVKCHTTWRGGICIMTATLACTLPGEVTCQHTRLCDVQGTSIHRAVSQFKTSSASARMVQFTNFYTMYSQIITDEPLTSKWPYSTPFWNAKATNKSESADFAHLDLKHWLPWQRPVSDQIPITWWKFGENWSGGFWYNLSERFKLKRN